MDVISEQQARRNISINLRRLMSDRGITQAKLARLTDMTEMQISRIVRGMFEPGIVSILRIAEALETSVEILAKDPKKENAAMSA